MRIIYAKFVNFKGIFNGTGRTELELDFSKAKNKIILLSGKNGSGKSTVLSLLHPFSGTLDGRSNPIIRDTVGYKEIIIEDGNEQYLIKHHYDMTKKRTTIKSFFAKRTVVGDWEELNENGTVKSFEILIKDYLDVDTSFFTLSRIGSNVEGFIDKTPTERKKYISSFLPSIDEYLMRYKVVSDQWSDLNKRIKNVVESINKLDSIDHILATLENLNNRLDQLRQSEKEYESVISRAEGFIEAKDPNGELLNEYNEVLVTFKEANSKFKNIKTELEDSKYGTKEEAIKAEKKLTKALSETATELAKLEAEYNSAKNKKTAIEESIERDKDSLDSIVDSTTIDEYKEIISERTKDLKEATKDLKSLSHVADLNITNENIPRFEVAMNGLVEYSEAIVDEFTTPEIEVVRDSELTTKELESTIRSVETVIKELKDKKSDLEDKRKFYLSKTNLSGILEQKPDDCVNYSCAFIAEAVKYQDAPEKIEKILKNIKKVESDIKASESTLEDLKRKYKLHSQVSLIIKSYKRSGTDITDLKPDFKLLTKEDVVNFIFSDKSFLTSTSDMRQYMIVQSIIKSSKDEIKRAEQMVEQLNSQEKLVSTLKKSIKTNKDKLAVAVTEIEEIKVELDDFKARKQRYEERLAHIDDIIPLFNDSEQLRTVIKDSKLKYDKMKETIEEIKEKRSEVDEVQELLDEVISQIEPLVSEIDRHKLNIERLKEYNADKAILEEKLKVTSEIRDALSPTKGIPLLFIDVYLEQTKIIANELIDIAYNGSFNIDQFIINEKEFRIRMAKEEGHIDEDSDITDCSQGECALTSVALSMALIQQSMKRYNVLSLDEIDSELDADNRRAFLSIIESLMEKLGIEQTFIITHNKEFDTAPVDLILMPGSDINTDDVEFMKGKNIIFTA